MVLKKNFVSHFARQVLILIILRKSTNASLTLVHKFLFVAFKNPTKVLTFDLPFILLNSGSYDMIDDEFSAKPVTDVLFDWETGAVKWHSEYDHSEGTFSLTTNGKFHLCFGNGHGGYKTEDEIHKDHLKLSEGHHSEEEDHYDYTNTDGELRTIGFTLRVRPVEGTAAAALLKDKTTLENPADILKNKLLDLSTTLRDRMELLLDHQEYIKNREAQHRNIVEQTFSILTRWTLLEAFVLCAIATGQVLYLKKFFETKRYL